MDWKGLVVLLGGLILVVIVITSDGGTPPATPPPAPIYEFKASILGNTFEYTMDFESGDKPMGLWINVTYHDDLSITGLNFENGKITLDPIQGVQGNPYEISGGKPTEIDGYKIVLTPVFQYNETYSGQLDEPVTLVYVP